MTGLHVEAKKPWLVIIPIIIILALVASLAVLPVQADEPKDGKKPKLAPVNPKFTAFRQNPPAEFYGYRPHTVDLRHLKNIPVKKHAHKKKLSLPKSFAWKGKLIPKKPKKPEPPASGDNLTSEQPGSSEPPASGDNTTSEQPGPPEPPASSDNVTPESTGSSEPPASGDNVTSEKSSLPQSFATWGKAILEQLSLFELAAPGGKITLEQCDYPEPFAWGDNVTPVKDQGNCGTCWAFGTTAVLESAVLIGEATEYDFSEQSVVLCVDPSWVYLYDDPTDPCDGGGDSYIASEVFIRKGSVLESCNPYDTTLLDCSGTCACDTCAPVKKVNGYRLVTDDQSQTDLIKDAVYNHGPVTVAFYYREQSAYPDPTYGVIHDYYPYTGYANHLVSIIGWDDDVPHPDPQHSGTGAWLVKNSWGTEWGNNGYFWLAYDSSGITEVAYLEYEDYDPNVELLYWDEAGWVTSIGYHIDSTYYDFAWMANVFTMEQDGYLTHVDFWTTSHNAEYEIYVYGDGEPSDGLTNLLQPSQTGTCDETGYYSIELTDPIPLTADQDFTIAVKMTTPGYFYPISIELSDPGYWGCDPTIQPGVSYARLGDMASWDDLEDFGYNACLRAKVDESVIPEVSVSILPGSVNYGILGLGATKNTIELGSTITIKNNGNVNEDFKIKSSNAVRGGGTDWILITEGTPGENQFKHECSVEGGGWTVIGSDYGSPILTDVIPNDTSSLDLQITMPSSTTDMDEHTIIITILAVASGS